MKKLLSQKAIKVVKTTVGILLCVALIPLLVANITIIVNSYVNPDEVPSFLGYKPFIVLSDSMNPVINSGDLVITKETEAGALNVGDIISYRSGDSVVTHRIAEITETDGALSFITKGDANNTEDGKPVSADMVEGTTLSILPKLGNVALYMQTPVGMLVCIGIPVLLLVGYDIIRRRRYDREEQKKTLELEKELERMRTQANPG